MKQPDYLDQYRPNVGICLFNRKGQVWLGHRNDTDSQYAWQMPQGGMDEGEHPREAAFRELYEETGVKSVRLLACTPGWLVYSFPEDYRSRKKRNWMGQRQKWFAMLFEGKNSEINLDAHEEKEFSDWRWGELQETPGLIIPFKAGVYAEVAESFQPLLDWLKATN